jgi:hypothetical protein
MGAAGGHCSVALRYARKQRHLGRELMATGWTVGVHERAGLQVGGHRHAVELHVPALVNQASICLLAEDNDSSLPRLRRADLLRQRCEISTTSRVHTAGNHDRQDRQHDGLSEHHTPTATADAQGRQYTKRGLVAMFHETRLTRDDCRFCSSSADR